MARNARDMANNLMGLYLKKEKKRYLLSQDQFKRIAGKFRLRTAYIREVDSCLREDGYLLIDVRDEEDCIAVLRISTVMKFPEAENTEDYFFEDDDEDDWEDD